MNNIAKENIRQKLIAAIAAEGLTTNEAAFMLGFKNNLYISMIKNPSYWNKTPASAWEAALTWVNSGQSLNLYKTNHGKVRPDIQDQPAEIPTPPPPLEPAIRVKPEALEKRRKELAEKEKITAPLKVEKAIPAIGADFTDTARLKVCLDVEINLSVNGQRVQIS